MTAVVSRPAAAPGTIRASVPSAAHRKTRSERPPADGAPIERTTGSTAATVHLIGGPYVSCGGRHWPVPEGSKKLLAFVALRLGRVERPHAAGQLWPFGDEVRAAGNLRSALWRLRRSGIEVIDADKWSLCLAKGVEVDVHQLAGWASRLIHRTAEPADLTMRLLPEDACHLLSDWYDEWAVMERERVRQRVLHALEALSETLSAQGRHAEAVEAATRAVQEEPLRESAQRALMSAYLAKGNQEQAHRTYAAFAQLLWRELGVAPSRSLIALVRPQDGTNASRLARPV